MDLSKGPPSLRELEATVQELVANTILPAADAVDREARWPAEGIRALMDARITGLNVPSRLGGHGQGLAAIAVIVETIARGCPSARAREVHPDVVLCDIGLPGMDGYEVARRLRSEFDGISVFAVSGYAQPADLDAAARAGFHGHVAKPPPPEEIRRIIRGA